MPRKTALLRDALLERTELLDRLAVWQEIVDHLKKFLNTDSSQARHGIRTQSEHIIIPQETIVSVLDYISDGVMEEIKRRLEIIERSEVHVKDSGKKRRKSRVRNKEAAGERSTANESGGERSMGQ